MYFNQRIGRQLGGGFALVLAITLSVVAFGCLAMWRALDNAHEMKDRELPAVSAAQAIELHVLQTMYAIRSWTFSHDAQLLTEGRDHISKLRDDVLPAAAELAKREHLSILDASVATATKDIARYAELVDQTERAIAHHDRLVKVRLDTADAFLKEAIAFRVSQLASLQEEIVSDKGEKETGRRIARIERITSMVEKTYALRVTILIAQSAGDVSRLAEVNLQFEAISRIVKELLADTRRQENKDRLTRMEGALNLYH